MNRIIWMVLVFLICVSGVNSQDASSNKRTKRIYNTERLIGEQPEINGVLDDQCWQQQGEWATKFRQFLPNNYADPIRETEFKVLYDDANLYIAIRCFDDPDSVQIQGGRRDAMKGDVVGMAFDSYHDLRSAFEFDISAAGGKTDLFMIDDNFHMNWDAVWYGEVSMEDSAWTAEMRVPLSQLRFSDKQEHVWGLHVWRWIERAKEEDQWNVFHIDASSWADNFGELHGIRNLKKQRRIELLPYTLMRQDFYPEQPGNPFADGSDFDYNLGLDGKIGLSSNFTMDFTVNPDFGQVEADPSVLNLTAFETFYTEKRPFFLEGKSIFDFTLGEDQLFYSRRIGHKPSHDPVLGTKEYANTPQETTILNALKITGKTKNGLSLGVIQSITPTEKAEIDQNGQRRKETVEPWSNYFLTRALKEFNKGNTAFGAMLSSTQRFIDDDDTHLNYLPTDAFTGGFDFLHRWNNRAYYLDVKTVFSQIQGDKNAIAALQTNSRHYFQRSDIDHADLDTTRTSLGGYGGSVKIGKESMGKWHYSQEVTWKSPGLELNDMGYMRMADEITQETDLSYNVKKPTNIYRSYSIGVNQESGWDFGGRLIESEYELYTSWDFASNWGLYSFVSRNPQWRDTRILRGGPALAREGYWHLHYNISSDNRKKISYSLQSTIMSYDDNVTGQFTLQPGLTVRVGSRFNFTTNLSYQHNVDDAQYINTLSYNNAARYLLGRIDQETWSLTLRSDYAFTPNLILQYYVSPYISTGEFSHIKYVTDADADDADNRYHTFTDTEISSDQQANTLVIDEDGDGTTDYSLGNPDFNFFEIHSNMVLRWEFTPGSTFYFVWTHGRSDYLNDSVRTLGKNADRLFSVKPQNIFMVKLNYWFTL